MGIRVSLEYTKALNDFLSQLTAQQQSGQAGVGRGPNTVQAVCEAGRKYDKIVIHAEDNASVRYFVDRKDGSIYGAKSRFAPNLKWYFGTIENCGKWDWSDFHGTPVMDDTVRRVGSYGPYHHYMRA